MWTQTWTNVHRHRGMNQLFAVVLGLLVTVMYAVAALIEAKPLLKQIGQENGETELFSAALLIVLVVMMLFSVMFMVYLNGLLVERREGEFQLYRRLGMPQWRLNVSLMLEVGLCGLAGLAGGLVGGVVVSKLLAMVLLRLVDSRQTVGLLISPIAIAEMAGFVAVLLVMLGSLRALSASGRDLAAKKSAADVTVVKPVTPVMVIGALIGAVALAWGTWVLMASLMWTTRMVHWLGGDWGIAVIFLGFMFAEVIGIYLLYACLLPLLIAWRLKRQATMSAKHYLWLVAMYQRLRINTQSLWLTTWLTTVTLVMLGSAAMLYQYGQVVVAKEISQSILTTTAGQHIVKQAVPEQAVVHTWQLSTKLVAGETKLRTRNHANLHEKSIFQVIALRDYQRIARQQKTLPPVTLTHDQALLITAGQTLYQTKGIGGWNNLGRRMTLTQSGQAFTIKMITNSFPLGESGYFDRALVVSDRAYARLKAPVDRLTGIQLKPTQRRKIESKLMQTDLREYVSLDHATLSGQKSVAILKHSTPRSLERDGLSLRRPAIHEMRVLFGFLLFIMTLLGVVLMVATASTLLLKQLVAAGNTRRNKVTLQRLGMPAKDWTDLQVTQVVAVFGLPLMLGSFNAILGLHQLQVTIDAEPNLAVVIAFGAYTLVYLGFAAITAMWLTRD